MGFKDRFTRKTDPQGELHALLNGMDLSVQQKDAVAIKIHDLIEQLKQRYDLEKNPSKETSTGMPDLDRNIESLLKKHNRLDLKADFFLFFGKNLFTDNFDKLFDHDKQAVDLFEKASWIEFDREDKLGAVVKPFPLVAEPRIEKTLVELGFTEDQCARITSLIKKIAADKAVIASHQL